MSRAIEIMQELNPHAVIGIEGDRACFIEDVKVDEKFYRLETQATLDGTRAVAFCRYMPWPDGNPFAYEASHLRADGAICMSSDSHGDLAQSRMDVRTAIMRARYWAVGYSVLRETGTFPQPPNGANA